MQRVPRRSFLKGLAGLFGGAAVAKTAKAGAPLEEILAEPAIKPIRGREIEGIFIEEVPVESNLVPTKEFVGFQERLTATEVQARMAPRFPLQEGSSFAEELRALQRTDPLLREHLDGSSYGVQRGPQISGDKGLHPHQLHLAEPAEVRPNTMGGMVRVTEEELEKMPQDEFREFARKMLANQVGEMRDQICADALRSRI